jgi:hypothetical protein
MTRPFVLYAAALLGLLPCASGCLVIEKRTLVCVLPAESNEIRMYYLFEGLSVWDDNNSSLDRAVEQMDDLKKDSPTFFFTGSGSGQTANEELLLKQLRFEPLRFYRDPSRKRPLCAERKAVVSDRKQFAAALNSELTRSVREFTRNDVNGMQAKIKEANQEMKKPEAQRDAEGLGFAALLTVGKGLGELAEEFDADSLQKIQEAADADKDFAWVRFGPGTMRVVIPVTAACARKIVANPAREKWLKEMRAFATPLRLKASDDGLEIVLGKKGEPVRFTLWDKRPYRKENELALSQRAGTPKPIRINGRPATGEMLIERFVADAMKKR